MTSLNLNLDSAQQRQGAAASAEFKQDANRYSDTPFYDPFKSQGSEGGLFGQLVNPTAGSENYNKLVEVMKKAAATATVADAIDIIPFPKEVHTSLHFSVIVVVRNNRVLLGEGAPQHNFVTAQALLIEATGDTPRAYTNSDNPRRPYLVTPTSEDANNSLLVAYLTEKLNEHYKPAASAVYLIDPIVIRRTFNIDDVEAVKKQLANSVVAVETRSQVRVPGFTDFNFIKRMGANDLQLPVGVTLTSGETHTDSQGLPVHMDAVVEVSVERAGSRNRGPIMNSPQDSRMLCQTGVMVELIAVDPQYLSENRSRSRNRHFEPEVAWAPRAVATNIEQFLTRTPAGIMFAIASIAEIGRDRGWAQTFRHVKGPKDAMSLRDVGYLNIEANIDGTEDRWGRPIDTKDPAFDDRQLGLLLDNTVTRSMMIAVDCMTTGPQAYYTTSLYNLARGRADAKKRAHAELISSMMDATDGRLANFIDVNNCQIVEGDGELLHTGFWYDNNSKARDIREIDNYLAIAVRSGDSNPELITQWSDTWLRTDIPEQQRLSDRLAIIQSAASGTVNVTGTALRVTINDALIDAFVRAMEDGKLPLVSRVTGSGDAFVSQRSVSRLADRALYSGSGFGRGAASSGGRSYNQHTADRY